MLTIVKCPHCRRLIGTDQEVGQTIPCPHCRDEFDIERHMLVRSSKLKNTLIKLCIPLGYVLFVAVPLGFTIWFLANRAEEQERAQRDAADDPPAEVRPAAKQPPAPNKQPRPKTKDRDPRAVAPDAAEPPADPKPEVAPPPRPVEPAVVRPAPPVAPKPPERDELHVAPEPHDAPWPPALVAAASEWQKVGAVDVRVGGFAVTRVPLLDGAERVRESAQPHLVVVVEVRMNAAGKKRELQAWRAGQEQYGVIFLNDGKELPFAQFQLGTKLNAGIPAKQPIPADGGPVRGVLLFAVPPNGAGEMSLRLDAVRCGESGDIWFKIPADAWKKK